MSTEPFFEHRIEHCFEHGGAFFEHRQRIFEHGGAFFEHRGAFFEHDSVFLSTAAHFLSTDSRAALFCALMLSAFLLFCNFRRGFCIICFNLRINMLY